MCERKEKRGGEGLRAVRPAKKVFADLASRGNSVGTAEGNQTTSFVSRLQRRSRKIQSRDLPAA